MELRHLKARLALLDNMLNRMSGSSLRMRHIRRTIFVLRAMILTEENLRSPYGPETPIAQFSLQ